MKNNKKQYIEIKAKNSPIEYFECDVKYHHGKSSGRYKNTTFTFQNRNYRRSVKYRKIGGFENYDYDKLKDDYVYCVEVRKSIFNTYFVEKEYLKQKVSD